MVSEKNRLLLALLICLLQIITVKGQDSVKVKKDSISVYGSDVELNQVVVSSSRINSYINANPIRIEILGEEDLLEKAIENPGNISEMLTELSAVQLVQTSLISGNTNFRLLGLNGNQSLLLKDGFPMFGGLSQDLSFMQIAPFNIKQVEIIKGSSSVFFGNGAMGGAINIITKDPGEKSSLKVLLNRSTLGSLKKNLPGSSDAAVFASGKNESLGYTFSGNMNFKSAIDINGDRFTEIPDLKKIELEPKLYFYFDTLSSLTVNLDYLQDKRTGGDMNYFSTNDPALYYNSIATFRRSGFITFNKNFNSQQLLTIKTSFSYMNKTNDFNNIHFAGNQSSSYSELSYSLGKANNSTVFGVNLSTEVFKEVDHSNGLRNYSNRIAGVFVEDQYRFSDEFTGEAGLRLDNHNNYGSYLIPAAAIIYKPSNVFFARLSAGTGYRAPSLFASDDEEKVMSNVIASSFDNKIKSERSLSTILDLNYTQFIAGDISARINQIFYYTEVKNPFELHSVDQTENLVYINEGAFHNYGTETNLNFNVEETGLFVGFSYNHSPLSLTPDYKLVYMLAFDEEESGIQVDFGGMTIGAQQLSNGTKVKEYSTIELLLSKTFGKFTFVLNGENLLDYKQSSRGPLLSYNNISKPLFNEIYSPVTGREINLAVMFSM